MRIFYVCADRGIPPDGTKGASIHFRSLAAALAAEGHTVTAFASARPANGVGFPTRLARYRGPETLAAAAARHGPPAFVCERYSLGAMGGIEGARMLGVPFVLEVNAPLVLEATRHRPESVRPGDEAIERRLFRDAHRVVCVSEPLRRFVAAARGTDEGTAVLRNGAPEVRPPPRADDGATIAFLGHPKPWHGAERLPDLVRALPGTRLLVVGGGKGADSLRTRAREAGVLDRVEITGAVPPAEVPAHLARATVAVAPYPPTEFFYFCPLKVIECMALGLPVVASDQGDIGAILDGSGVLVPPGSDAALAAAVRALLDDPARRIDLGARASARAAHVFTWRATARRLLAVAGAEAPA